MRKRNFRLMKKTLEWYHRRKGAAGIVLPANVPSESYRCFKILGSDADSGGTGVGDYNEELNSYEITLHAHGKNFMSGEEFMEIHSALNISKIAPTIVSECYSTTPMPEYNGTVVIGPQHVKFKKGTPYTLALRMKYFTSSSKRVIGLRFDYSDGSYDVPYASTSSRDIFVCFTSNPTKDLVAISSHNESATNVRFGIAEFGLYEGAYTEFDDAFEAYCGEKSTLTLTAPLLKIDYSADTLDIVNGKMIKKIHVAQIDGSAEISETDKECVFEITLPTPARPATRIVSDFEPLTEECESGLSISESGESIFFKASNEITSKNDMLDYLNQNPFKIAYVMRDYVYSDSQSIDIPLFEKDSPTDILSQESPSKAYVEYV